MITGRQAVCELGNPLRALVADEGVVLWGRVVNLHRALNTLLHADIRAATGLDGTEFEFLLTGNATRRTAAPSASRLPTQARRPCVPGSSPHPTPGRRGDQPADRRPAPTAPGPAPPHRPRRDNRLPEAERPV